MFCLWNFDGRNSWRFYNLYCEMNIFWTYPIAFDILFFRLMLCYYLLHVYNFETVRVCTVNSLKVWYFIKGLLFLCINFSVILTSFTSFVLQRPRWAFKHCKMDSSFWLFQIFFEGSFGGRYISSVHIFQIFYGLELGVWNLLTYQQC